MKRHHHIHTADFLIIGHISQPEMQLFISISFTESIAVRDHILFEIQTDLSESLLQVYDKNGRDLYDLRMDTTHPVSLSGGAEELIFGNNILLIRTQNKLFRLSGNGDDLASAEISQDTVTVLPTEDEVLVCTPAYAARLDKKDFKRE
jgi:hypothetical protein